MKKFLDKKLSYFGKNYELKLLKEIIGAKEEKGSGRYRRDASFGKKILRKLKEEHFENELSKKTFSHILKYYNSPKGSTIPWFDTLESLYKANVKDDLEIEMLMDYLEKIKNVDDSDKDFVQDNSLNFINTKNITSTINHVLREYIDKGKYEEFDNIANMIQDSILEAKDDDELEAFVEGDHSDLFDEERHPIPTGIESLDIDMNGGLAYGELALVIAALKVGKTTYASFIANHAAQMGYNVLQIFFEDTPEQVKIKHRAKFTGKGLNVVTNKRNKKSIARESDTKLRKIKKNNGCLVLHKMDSTESKVADIEKVLLKARERGVWFSDTQEYKKIKFDLVLIDYVDCINPKKQYKDPWSGDKEILRDLEKLASPKNGLGFACWAFTQGGRSSLNTSLVTVEEMGGSIKKAQIAHFIMSIAKTIDQRSEGKATVAILGSRIGRDGIIYKDCTFNNANMEIDFKKEGNISEITTHDILN